MSGRPEALFALFAGLETLAGIGEKTAKSLAPMGVTLPRDLLFTLPHSVIDRRPVKTVQGVPAGSVVTVELTIDSHSPARRRGLPDRVLCHDSEIDVTLVFFHARGDWLARHLPVGARRIVSGKLEIYDGMAQIVHPDHMVAPEQASEIARFEPVYPLTAGISQKLMTKAVQSALSRAPQMAEWIDPALKTREGWPDWNAALRKAHAPEALEDVMASAPRARTPRL